MLILQHLTGMHSKLIIITLLLIAAVALASCQNTSLSDPNGSGHSSDLSLYELTGQSSNIEVTEADISAARRRGGSAGSLPVKGARVLLVQSGAHQPDGELVAAFRPYCEPVMWDGRGPATPQDGEKPTGATLSRRLRLAAAQQRCSHVIVVFGEIQSDSRSLPTRAVSWVPVVGGLVPSKHSGTRLLAQALIMETATSRYTLAAAAPQQTSVITTKSGGEGITRRRIW
jgi:hypothetical protein